MDGAGVSIESFPPSFSTKAAFPSSSKAGSGIKLIGRIDPSDSANQFGCDIQSKVDILGPDRGRQSIAGIIGQSDRFGGGAKSGTNQDRTKNFLLH